jgi:hypothetical protein
MTMPTLAVPKDIPARRAAIQHFLRTGDYDLKFPAWSGNVIEGETKGTCQMYGRALSCEG